MNYYQRYMRKLRAGRRISPRGMPVTAAYNVVYTFMPGTCWRREKDNPAIGFAEGLQFIGETENKEAIAKAAPHVNLNLFGPTSFYGVRVQGQFDRVIKELETDEFSRRAVLFVAHENDSSETMPCTLNLIFHINEKNQLETTINMRSSDAVWGLPYDQIQFGMVSMAVASCLGIEIGLSTINIANAHIYDDHPGSTKWVENYFSMPKMPAWSEYKAWANYLINSSLDRPSLEEYFKLSE